MLVGLQPTRVGVVRGVVELPRDHGQVRGAPHPGRREVQGPIRVGRRGDGFPFGRQVQEVLDGEAVAFHCVHLQSRGHLSRWKAARDKLNTFLLHALSGGGKVVVERVGEVGGGGGGEREPGASEEGREGLGWWGVEVEAFARLVSFDRSKKREEF